MTEEPLPISYFNFDDYFNQLDSTTARLEMDAKALGVIITHSGLSGATTDESRRLFMVRLKDGGKRIFSRIELRGYLAGIEDARKERSIQP